MCKKLISRSILTLSILSYEYLLLYGSSDDIDVYVHSQPQAREKAQEEGFEVSVAKTSFKANTKALAENEGEGLAKVGLLCHNVCGYNFVDRHCNFNTSCRYPSTLDNSGHSS